MEYYLKNGFVLTGGPGGGKTTLIEELKKRGYYTFDEEAKKIIRKSGIENFHFKYPIKAVEEGMKKYILNYELAKNLDICFFDRGFPEAPAYLRFIGVNIPKKILDLCKNYKYNKNVFLIELLEKSKYNNPKEHGNFTWEQTLKYHDLIKKTYKEFGYNTISIPTLSIEDRADMILSHIE